MPQSALSPPSPVRVALAAREPALAAMARDALAAPDYRLIEVDPCDLDACAALGSATEAWILDQGDAGAGLAVAARLREEGDPPPLVLVASSADPDLDRRALRHGIATFLEWRELNPSRLERTIRYVLAQRRQSMQISRLAQYDPLTGLANRSLFEDRLGRALARARRSGLLVAVMVLDLNGFKAVNDQLGHPAGDRLLRIMAARLTGRLRETDTVARLGGDEFALVIENLAKPSYAALVARKVMDAVVPPIEMAERSVHVTASLGIALHPEDGATGPLLLERADQAMYRAKAEGGHRCRFCRADPGAPVHAAGIREGELEEALCDGLELRFRLQVPLSGGEVAVAALPSWQHPAHGTIEAARFLPLAEDAGLLGRLMDWILAAGCRQLRAWRACGFAKLRLALPLVSRRQLAWDDLPERLERALDGLDPAGLELEVPEDLVLADLEAGENGLRQLRLRGVRIALAWYGTGSLSMTPLGIDTIDSLKIALAGLPGSAAAPGRAAILRAVLGCAGEMGIRTVVAGDVDPVTEALLREQGCSAIEPPASRDEAATSAWLSAALAEGQPGAAAARSRLAG